MCTRLYMYFVSIFYYPDKSHPLHGCSCIVSINVFKYTIYQLCIIQLSIDIYSILQLTCVQSRLKIIDKTNENKKGITLNSSKNVTLTSTSPPWLKHAEWMKFLMNTVSWCQSLGWEDGYTRNFWIPYKLTFWHTVRPSASMIGLILHLRHITAPCFEDIHWYC